MPRAKTVVSSDDFEAVSAATPPELPPSGDDFDVVDIQVVRGDYLTRKAKEEKFMNEKVMILIEPGTEPNDPVYVHLGHNGIPQYVKRGTPQVVKRKFLYSALMGKRVTMNCTFGKDNNGNEYNKLTPSVSTAYRTTLVNDPNPQAGMKWVQSVMAESAGMH